MAKCLGLIGGLGPAAAIHYYRELVQAQDALGRPLDLVMVNADMHRAVSYVQQGQIRELAQYLAGLIARLKAGGAELAVVPAVTPHICIRELETLSPLPIVSILSSTAEAVRLRGLKRVALFGTRFTVQGALFGALEGVEVVRPSDAEIDRIHEVYYSLASTGRGSAAQHQQLTELARTLVERDRVEAILIAGTDFAVLFDETNTTFPYVDCAREHIAAIVKALG